MSQDPLPNKQLDLLEVLFEQMPIAILDCDLVLCRCNPAWVRLIERYARYGCAHPMSTRPAGPGVRLGDLVPGIESAIASLLERVLSGEVVRHEALPLQSSGPVFYWDVVLAPLIAHGEVKGVACVATDATERVLAYQALERRVADRTRELSALYDVAAAASASLDLETVMERSLERVLAVMESEVGAIHLLDGTGKVLRLAASRGISPGAMDQIDSVPVEGGLAGWAILRDEPLVVPNISASPRPLLAVPAAGSQAYVGVPVRARGQVLGVLSVVGKAGRQFEKGDVSLLASIADQVGVAVENAQLYQHAEQLAAMRERQRLARELHDSVTQSLYSLVLLAEAGRRLAGAGDLRRVEEVIVRLGEIGHQTLKEMRLLVYELRPAALLEEGLVSALQHRLDAVERRAGVEACLVVEGEVQLLEGADLGGRWEDLYRIVQEALNNALKHAMATSVTVQIRVQDGGVDIEVTDNGRGFDPDAVRGKGGMGLANMRERAEWLGGTLTVLSAPGKGTTVKVSVGGTQWRIQPNAGRRSAS